MASELPALVTPSCLTHGQPWFEDGNVVLVAENVAFKIFRGILAHNSDVFRDLFSVAQPGVEQYDGCPRVEIFDRADDATHFLTAIHDASYYDTRTTSDFAVVAGVLRMATKYNVPFLRERALSHLVTMFPSSLQDFQENRSQSSNYAKLTHYTGLSMEVVHLAKAARVPKLLPISLYYCAVMRLEYILDGVPVGTEGEPGYRRVELDWEEKRTILLGRRALVDRTRHSLFGFLLTSPPSLVGPNGVGCTSPQQCELGRLKHLREMEPLLSGDKCGPLHIQFDHARYAQDVCTFCMIDGKNKYRDGLRKAWEELPACFNLGPWEVLKDDSQD